MVNLIIFNKIIILKPDYGAKGSLVFLKDKIYFVFISGMTFNFISVIRDLFFLNKINKELKNLNENTVKQFLLDKKYIEISKNNLKVFMPENWFSTLKFKIEDKKYSFNVGSERKKLNELKRFLISENYDVKN